MMTASEVSNARLARQMNRLLGNFSADVNTGARINRLLEGILRRACAPSDPRYRLHSIADQLRLAPERTLHDQHQLSNCLRSAMTEPTYILFTKPALRCEAKPQRELRVVAELGMRIEWQVIRK